MCDHDDGFNGFDWQDIALIGALSESLVEEERERRKTEMEIEEDRNDDK
jgi:hypothetical protein